jgi:hypothetical protein
MGRNAYLRIEMGAPAILLQRSKDGSGAKGWLGRRGSVGYNGPVQ